MSGETLGSEDSSGETLGPQDLPSKSGDTLGPQDLRKKFLKTIQYFFSGKIVIPPRPDFTDEDSDGPFQQPLTKEEFKKMVESSENQEQKEE